MKETKRSLVSRSSALFHFSISLSLSSYFFSSLLTAII